MLGATTTWGKAALLPGQPGLALILIQFRPGFYGAALAAW